MIVAYVRVSSPAQSFAMQREAINRCASQRGDKIAHWYAEKASATRTMQRPELAALRQAAKEGRIAKVYVYRIDRFSRTGIRDTLGVLDEFKRHGAAVVSVADSFDVTSGAPGTEIVIAALAWAAEVEGDAIRERMAAARKAVEAKGGRWGRPPRMTPEQVARAVAYKDKGWSVRRISAAMKIPRPTVVRALQRVAQKPPPKPLAKTAVK